MTTTLVDESQFDPVALAHWRACRCEFCMLELKERGLPLEPPTAAADTTPEPTEPAKPKLDPKKRARLVLKLRERGESVDDIAKDLGITKARVYQILKKAEKTEKVEG